jgi:hypothetical protein
MAKGGASPQIHFYATKNDLISLLGAVERQRDIKYLVFGRSKSKTPTEFEIVSDLPELGKATHESSVASRQYLVCKKDGILRPRPVGADYAFDQLINPETVSFNPGGVWKKGILLKGGFGTASGSDFSLELMKLLRSTIRKHFRKIRGFFVGAEAEQMLDRGDRLTFAEQCPRTMDLTR